MKPSDTPKTPDDELHKILDEYYADRKNTTGTDSNAHRKAIRRLKAREARILIKKLESLLDIPSKYIDDDTMVYWSDFNADTLANIIKEHIAQIKHDSMPDETKGGGDDQ